MYFLKDHLWPLKQVPIIFPWFTVKVSFPDVLSAISSSVTTLLSDCETENSLFPGLAIYTGQEKLMVMSDWWNLMRFTSVNIMGTVQHLYVQENENISYENAYAHGLKSENPDTSKIYTNKY